MLKKCILSLVECILYFEVDSLIFQYRFFHDRFIDFSILVHRLFNINSAIFSWSVHRFFTMDQWIFHYWSLGKSMEPVIFDTHLDAYVQCQSPSRPSWIIEFLSFIDLHGWIIDRYRLFNAYRLEVIEQSEYKLSCFP